MLNDVVFFKVFEKEALEQWPELFLDELRALEESKQFSTSFLILPWLDADFGAYLDVLDLSQLLLEEEDWDEVFQLASFHPKYQFAETQQADVSNKTNQSPHALIHLLQIDEVEKAIAHYDGETSEIPARNIALMNHLFASKK